MSTLSNRIKAYPQRSGMTHEQWRRVKRLRNPRRSGRYFHDSGTYCAGRNKAKRERRLLHGVRK